MPPANPAKNPLTARAKTLYFSVRMPMDAAAVSLSRTAAMAMKMRVEVDCAMTGGGAIDVGLVKTMEKENGQPILEPENPMITGAIGAALIANER